MKLIVKETKELYILIFIKIYSMKFMDGNKNIRTY